MASRAEVLNLDSCRRESVLGSCPKVSNASVARCVPRWMFADFTLGHPGHCDEGRAQDLIAMCMAALTPSPFAFILHVFVARHTRSAFSLDTASISAHALQAEALGRHRSHRWASAPPHGISSGRWHPVEWASTLLGDERTSSHVPAWPRGWHRVSVERPSLRCSCNHRSELLYPHISLISQWHR